MMNSNPQAVLMNSAVDSRTGRGTAFLIRSSASLVTAAFSRRCTSAASGLSNTGLTTSTDIVALRFPRSVSDAPLEGDLDDCGGTGSPLRSKNCSHDCKSGDSKRQAPSTTMSTGQGIGATHGPHHYVHTAVTFLLLTEQQTPAAF